MNFFYRLDPLLVNLPVTEVNLTSVKFALNSEVRFYHLEMRTRGTLPLTTDRDMPLEVKR